MPIPAFDNILNIIPPHIGDPRIRSDLSPYQCSVTEVCDRFATSPRRKQILEGLLRFRAELMGIGVAGFQWIGGSFMEDIEVHERRDPNDIDIVTFVDRPSAPADIRAALNTRPDLFRRADVKATYFVDHLLVPLRSAPVLLVDNTRYWYGLFSHRRDLAWKGMLVVDLLTNVDDDAARLVLGGK